MRNRLKLIPWLAAGLLSTAMYSCSGGLGSDTSIDPARSDGFAAGAPSSAELESLLMQEFDRLGIDPGRVVQQAPIGPQNIVFDLRGTVVDPDGELGPLPPTGIRLNWTELANGDYDQNGVIAVNDLTPIGQFFQTNVSYDDPSLHGGFPAWPAGDPADDGGAEDDQPPASGSPAENWRRSRVDGNSDGVISVQDLTNIAVHFGEKIAGYRVYRKAPGDSDFVLRPNPENGAAPLTIGRPDAASLDVRRPITYDFVDDVSALTLEEGQQLQYYVAPYDVTGSSEGQPSITLTMSIGSVNNNPPVADIVANPDPVEINTDVVFDASGSTDDFGIDKYEWDLDGNGSFETDTGSTSSVTTQYEFAGPKTVTVRVTDAGGLTDTDFTTLQVIAPEGHIISGFVLVDGTEPLGGVQMQLSPGGQTTQTVADGSYSFGSIPDGDYSVSATISGYTMNPNPAMVTLAGADATDVNFTATELSGDVYTVSGNVSRLTEDWTNASSTPAPDEGIAGVLVQVWASDGGGGKITLLGSDETDANGDYSIPGLPPTGSNGIMISVDPAAKNDVWIVPVGGDNDQFRIPFESDQTANWLDKNGFSVTL